MFFGGGRRGGGRPRGRQKGEDFVHPLKVTLEQLYNGKTTKLAMNKKVLCSGCRGSGAREGASEVVCSGCSGRGMKVQLRRLGPGMVQQMQSPCGECSGQGKSIAEGDKCRDCRGQKVVKERKVLEVNIEKGMKNKQRITFRGEGDESPDADAGDVIFILQLAEHDVFKRRNADLLIEKEISLVQALTGVQFTLTHMDRRQLLISTPPGNVVPHESVLAVMDEGFPLHGNPFVKGNLFVKFNVVFPPSVSPQQAKVLKSVLPPPSTPAPIETEDMELCRLEHVDIQSLGQSGQHGSSSAYDSDEDNGHGHGHGQPGVQCAQQ